MTNSTLAAIFFVWTLCWWSLEAKHVLMERLVSREKLKKLAPSPPGHEHEIIFAVKQKNLDVLEEAVLQRSDPDNFMYQKWLSFDEVTSLVQNMESTQEVLNWLKHENVEVVWKSTRSEYIKARAPIAVWEALLLTQFFEWEDTADGTRHTQHIAEHYSLPEALLPHVEGTFFTCQAPPIIHGYGQLRRGDRLSPRTTFESKDLLLRRKTNKDKVDLQASNGVNVPYINSFYRIASNIASSSLKQSVFQTNEQFFSQDDLQIFQDTYHLTRQYAEAPYGYEIGQCFTNGSRPNCDEGNLDIQYIMGVAQKAATVYWYVGGTNPFVTWITDAATSVNPPSVNSISWGSVEQDYGITTLTAFNTEALKLAAQGVTILVSTGDHGVANFGCPCDSNKAASTQNCACSFSSSSADSKWTGTNTWTGTGYFPSFPATCPYVTAVGATMGNAGNPPNIGEKELACQSQLGGVITTGGGFSTFYPRPSWQSEAIPAFLAQTTAAAGYNPMGRGIPDISLVGVAYEVVINKKIFYLYGTSASAPVFAAFVTLVNADRLKANRSTIGFLNPTLYKANHSRLYNDVTSGSNGCCANPYFSTCCTASFSSSVGWDPVTGWGTVDFPQFAAMFNSSIPFSSSGDEDNSDKVTINLNTVAIVGFVLLSVAVCVAAGVLVRFLCKRNSRASPIVL